MKRILGALLPPRRPLPPVEIVHGRREDGHGAVVADDVHREKATVHGEVCGLPLPEVSSCLPPLVVKLVSEPSCVRFLSSSAIRDYYLCHW
jgi:hypothetical protein